MPEQERETMEMDIVFVGAGVANLSAAYRLMKRIQDSGLEKDPPQIVILEKATYTGAHALSGAVMDPSSMKDLMPDFKEKGAPIESPVHEDAFYRLTRKGAMKVPFVPPDMRAEGCLIISLSSFNKWFAERVQEIGVDIYEGFAARELLTEGSRVTGVRLGDKGVDKNGEPKATFEPGMDFTANLVVLGEGAHGFLTERAMKSLKLNAGKHPQAYVAGIKEVIKVPNPQLAAGRIIHTFGYPLDMKTFGGSFIYGMSENRVSLGLCVGLDYANPYLEPHDLFRKFKAHPLVHKFIAGGEVVQYGSKVIPEGGFFAVPELVSDGLAIVGDGAGLLNAVRLKGIHLAIRSGLCLGDAIFSCWKDDKEFTKANLKSYPEALTQSQEWIGFRKVRNVHQTFHWGALAGMVGTGLSWISGGALPPGELKGRVDGECMRPKSSATKPGDGPAKDDKLFMDKLTDVYNSGTTHEEDQPCHLKILDREICLSKCGPTYDYPCTRFCPAQVYELAQDEAGKPMIKISFSNCLHCKTCEIKDPLKNIEWTLPEAGGGPKYSVT